MAEGPWRCSQCGTVNEPVANSCRTCGRWPSLFDLEASRIDDEPPISYDDADEFAAQTVDVEVVEPTTVEPQMYEPVAPADAAPTIESDAGEHEDEAQPKPVWQRMTSLIIPIGVVVYLLINAFVNNSN